MSGAQQHLDLERLARVIAMGGSGHDGEALAALRQADRSIRDAGMTWHDVLLPGRLIEALAAEVQQLRDELTALRAAKAAETQQLRDALTAVRHRRRPTQHQRGAAPLGIIILGCIAAMYIMFGDIIGGCAGGAVPVANSAGVHADRAGVMIEVPGGGGAGPISPNFARICRSSRILGENG
jgi:hypothetical protein